MTAVAHGAVELEAPAAASTLGGLQGLPYALTAVGAVTWWRGATQVDLAEVTDVGMVTALPPWALLAPLLVIAGFGWSVRRGDPEPVLAAHVITLVTMLFGLAAVVEPVAGLKVVWRHAGVIEVIDRTGSLDPSIDAYFNWPGFFALGAVLVELTGLRSAHQVAEWSPVLFNLLYLAPVVTLFRTATPDRRLVWSGALVFVLGNWITQDYFAPQALAYLTHLVIVSVLVRWFHPGSEPLAPAVRAGLMVLVLGAYAACVASHQLTPFATLLAVGALVVGRECTRRTLPATMALVLAAWLAFMAQSYLSGHLGQLLGSVGDVSSAADANLSERLGGSSGHLVVVRVRVAIVLGLVGLAVVGWWRSRGQRGTRPVALIAIAATPLPLLQPYGGEMVMRVFLFLLPAVAFFTARTLLGAPGHHDRAPVLRCVRLAAVAAALSVAFLVARYGNERMDHFTDADVAAVEAMYGHAPPGALLLAAVDNLPWKAQGYEVYEHRTVEGSLLSDRAHGTVASAVRWTLDHRPPAGALFVRTRSQDAWIEIMGSLPPGAMDEIEAEVRETDGVQLVHAGDGSRVYRIAGRGGEG